MNPGNLAFTKRDALVYNIIRTNASNISSLNASNTSPFEFVADGFLYKEEPVIVVERSAWVRFGLHDGVKGAKIPFLCVISRKGLVFVSEDALVCSLDTCAVQSKDENAVSFER